MYDCIVLESPNLPAGVTLAAVLDGCDEGEIATILHPIPDLNNIRQEDLEASGMPTVLHIRRFVDHLRASPCSLEYVTRQATSRLYGKVHC